MIRSHFKTSNRAQSRGRRRIETAVIYLKKVIAGVLLTLILAVMCPSLAAAGYAQDFYQGLASYEQGRYKEAAQFLARAADEVVNGKLYYNLGNAYLKSGDLGQAILWYERALTLRPRDPDLRFNLNQARSRLKDREEKGENVWIRVLFFWRNFLPLKTVQLLALIFNALLWIFLSLRLFWRKSVLAAAAGVCLILTLLLAPTAVFQLYEAAWLKPAVVLPEKLSVRSGFGDQATELFVLHAGTRVTVTGEKNGHRLIRFAPDKIGWVSKEDIGLILRTPAVEEGS